MERREWIGIFVVTAYRLSDGVGVGAEGSGEIKHYFILILNLWEDSGSYWEGFREECELSLPTFDYSLLKSHFMWIYMCSIFLKKFNSTNCILIEKWVYTRC